jgi:2-polyprenyl-3-methyl-5-hydroxy-6-metoxy-1,4-benzoquinol methylase
VDLFLVTRKVKRSLQNLIASLTQVFQGEITLKYGYYRILSQITFVGRRYIDGVNWEKYNKHYSEELKIIEKVHTLVINAEDYKVLNGKVDFTDPSKLPLHPNAQLLYETVLKLHPNSILEVGCGGGDHLANLKSLIPELEIHGVDLLDKQIEFLNNRHPNNDFKLKVVDISENRVILPSVDVIYTQAVLMHISEKESRFYNSMENLLKSSARHLVLVENWSQHHFLEAVKKITLPNKKWKIYFNFLEGNEKTRLMIISRDEQLNFHPLLDYNQLLLDDRLSVH